MVQERSAADAHRKLPLVSCFAADSRRPEGSKCHVGFLGRRCFGRQLPSRLVKAFFLSRPHALSRRHFAFAPPPHDPLQTRTRPRRVVSTQERPGPWLRIHNGKADGCPRVENGRDGTGGLLRSSFELGDHGITHDVIGSGDHVLSVRCGVFRLL